MTVIYVHGVKVRDEMQGVELAKPFRRWLQERLAVGGAEIGYEPVFWGGNAANFRWDLASRPKTKLLGMGGSPGFAGLGSLRNSGTSSILDRPKSPSSGGPVLGGAPVGQTIPAPPISSIPRGKRADFLADLFLVLYPKKHQGNDPLADEPSIAALADAAAEVAGNWDDLVAKEATEDARLQRLLVAMKQRLDDDQLLAMGAVADWLTKAGETVRRAATWPGDAVSTVFAELRPTVNEFVAYFIGDVLAYLNERGSADAPGEIPKRMLRALRIAHNRKKQTGERIVVVTHSMGGQLFYDAITHFASRDESLQDLQVDHWVSCGAQVSFFAELRLLKDQPDVQKPKKLPLPTRVTAWTNFYDVNDLVGFIMEPVFDGVKDLPYDTGYGLALAHTGFLGRPSFFQAIADALDKNR
ncbi:hypothetical protein [Rhizobium lentis]|uniref:Alpha/beta hydrolase n=1 Tax=Rhizobium lentis TaxID=1138194 RepID=A0A7W8XGN1_9HYPH|nr:hypothetical protein [Rhizobium lentis]MBB4575953.1 hypothetical protein [Rhizobium lentis]MBB5551984.1 hypothetical protein [Rhizobium lentis]MBB5562522.1 hypothetical protein [Rhizobium lentis]MBB5569931.1 hypothetical protein [Rhizobium lentis]